MIKKAAQITITFGLLVAAYLGYVQVFALVVDRVAPVRGGPAPAALAPRVSETAAEATRLAVAVFGPDHWSAQSSDQSIIRYYSHERGYWIYSRRYARKRDGTRVVFTPVVFIAKVGEGPNRKTISGSGLEAEVDFDRPFGLPKAGAEPARVVRAQIAGDVRLRDDNGTPHDPDDDLIIGPLTYLEFDQDAGEIRSTSPVTLRDRNLQIQGEGLRITLRTREDLGGFHGAKTLVLQRNVDFRVQDVGRSGVLPGTARPHHDDDEPTPLVLSCSGPMQVDFPKPRVLPKWGPHPPYEPEPTIATFTRNVKVKRGVDQSDQIHGDWLRATLLPAEPPPPGELVPSPSDGVTASERLARADAAAADTDGPLSDLTLRKAEVSGHVVWLLSEAQGLSARGNELIYEKRMPEQPDKMYFRSNANTRLRVEKIDRDDDGAIRSFETIHAMDLTLFDDGQGGASYLVARGPVLLESRPDRGHPVARTAEGRDELVMETAGGGSDRARRKITLKGQPAIADLASDSRMTSDGALLAWLAPGPSPATATDAASGPDAASSAFRIERVQAFDNVRLTAPGQNLTARRQLDVEFREGNLVGADRPDDEPPALARNDDHSADEAPAPEADDAPAPEVTRPEPPPVEVTADLIWARVVSRPEPATADDAFPTRGEGVRAGPSSTLAQFRGELTEARLRGSVTVHQEAVPDEPNPDADLEDQEDLPPNSRSRPGLAVNGEAIDLAGQGDGLYKFLVYHRDPKAPVEGPAPPPARIQSDFTIMGPVLGLDQRANVAWVEGRGQLIHLVDPGLLTDQALADADARATRPDQPDADAVADAPPPEKKPMVVSWGSSMRFFGQPTVDGLPRPAQAVFRDDVWVRTEDAVVHCQVMDVVFDRAMAFHRFDQDRLDDLDHGGGPQSRSDDTRPQIVFIRCRQAVTIVSDTKDPNTLSLRERHWIVGQDVRYSRESDTFQVLGDGIVRLYNRRQEGEGQPAAPLSDRGGDGDGGRVVRPVAEGGPNRPDGALPPLELTRIRFFEGMQGRLGAGSGRAATARREAHFLGDVQVLHALVADPRQDLDPDRPPPDFAMLTARELHVHSLPPPDPRQDAARVFLKALGDAQALTRDRTIRADIIHYDSIKDLFTFEGQANDVIVAAQAHPGQEASIGRGRTVFYNRRTGQMAWRDPQTFQWVDASTGTRLAPGAAPDPRDVLGDRIDREPNRNEPYATPRDRLRTPSSNRHRGGFRGGR